MIEHALNRITKSEEEGPLTWVGRNRNVDIRPIGIELPSLNMALVEVRRELAMVTIGAKDMAAKNKNLWKTIKVN